MYLVCVFMWMCMYVCGYGCHSSSVEFRGQVLETGSSLLTHLSQGSNPGRSSGLAASTFSSWATCGVSLGEWTSPIHKKQFSSPRWNEHSVRRAESTVGRFACAFLCSPKSGGHGGSYPPPAHSHLPFILRTFLISRLLSQAEIIIPLSWHAI